MIITNYFSIENLTFIGFGETCLKEAELTFTTARGKLLT